MQKRWNIKYQKLILLYIIVSFRPILWPWSLANSQEFIASSISLAERLSKYLGNYLVPHTVQMAPEIMFQHQVFDFDMSQRYLLGTFYQWPAGHWLAQWLTFWQMLHFICRPFLSGFFALVGLLLLWDKDCSCCLWTFCPECWLLYCLAFIVRFIFPWE